MKKVALLIALTTIPDNGSGEQLLLWELAFSEEEAGTSCAGVGRGGCRLG